ncbi:MAG: HAMP domain-containing sensor histidine kinase [Synergistaceae bacterium]|nr:HAMP domain-containing sensor histidine kinase [Synergistaceae bacterium]
MTCSKKIIIARCGTGAAMLSLWLLSQAVQFTLTPVYSNLSTAVALNESGYILLSAMWLLANNALRAVLLYSGWFMLSDGIAELSNSKYIGWVLPPMAIPISYFGIAFLHFPSVPHFGVPAVITLISVWLLQYIARDVTRTGYKFAILTVVVFAIQWLDLIPILTPYGFGWGELSYAVKYTSELMGKDHLLNVVCSIAFYFNAASAILLTKLFVSYEKQLKQLMLLRQRQHQIMQMRSEQSRLRLYQEMQYLVHDLKRPLTTIFGLADLLSMSDETDTARHSSAIIASAEKMDQMINEIKFPDHVRKTTVNEIINYTMSQVRVLSWGSVVIVDTSEDILSCSLNLNVIRFSRVLVNLLDNSWNATEHMTSPFILLGAYKTSGGVSFTVEDNGPFFFNPDDNEKEDPILPGLGLAFVKNAVKGFCGSIKYERRSEGGTICKIWIPETHLRES